MHNSARIQRMATQRGIQFLLHFTQVQNLPGIVAHGLLSREQINERGLDAFGSGRFRHDRKDDAVSLSISATYPKMFRAKQRAAGHSHWVLLLIDPSVLWNHRCRFLQQSAGRREIRDHKGYLGGPWAFGRMFSDEDRPSGIPVCLPTCPDAEVQVLEPILPEMILEAWVDRPDFAEAIQSELNRLPGIERNVVRCSRWPIMQSRGHEWLMPIASWERNFASEPGFQPR